MWRDDQDKGWQSGGSNRQGAASGITGGWEDRGDRRVGGELGIGGMNRNTQI